MARMIFFCKNCNSTYGADSGTINDCPDCKITLIETHITADFWRSLSDDQKEQRRKNIAHEFYLREQREREKEQTIANMLITSGFNFDGHKIVRYAGYISGDAAMTVNRGSSFTDGGVRDNLMASLGEIRRNALHELKEAAYYLGCNAVIGVDFDYITLDPHTANITGGTTYQPYVFCVTANGTAVVIEETND